MEPRRWEALTAGKLKGLFADHPTEVGLLPVGATEQHGPHLPTGTDTIIATALAEAVSVRTGAPVLPAVTIGCSYGHGTILGGTLSRSPEELAADVRGRVEWAAWTGLGRVLVINAHLGNAAALTIAGDHLRFHRPDLRMGVVSWWSADPEVAAEVVADGADVHANRAETALMLAIAPGVVDQDQIADADDPDRTGDLVFGYTATSLSRNGVTGRPSEASVILGERLLRLTVDALTDVVERARREEPPLVDHHPNPIDPVRPVGLPAGTVPC
jgi:creatinine amidohydrolase